MKRRLKEVKFNVISFRLQACQWPASVKTCGVAREVNEIIPDERREATTLSSAPSPALSSSITGTERHVIVHRISLPTTTFRSVSEKTGENTDSIIGELLSTHFFLMFLSIS